MSEELQKEMVHSLPGFENAQFLKYAYAIEYDAIRTEEYGPSLEIKKWPGKTQLMLCLAVISQP